MDEEEYEALLNEIDRLDTRLGPNRFDEGSDRQLEYLRDGAGIRVPGCYRVRPTPNY